MRSHQFPFPSMETDGNKSLCITISDQNYVLSEVNAIELGRVEVVVLTEFVY